MAKTLLVAMTTKSFDGKSAGDCYGKLSVRFAERLTTG